MTQTNSPTTPTINWPSLGIKMLIGAVIGLILITLFLFGDETPDPAWGKYYFIRPMIIVPLAGATGGAFYYLMERMRSQLGWNHTLTIFLSLLVFIVGLWLGSVLGLDGTYWN